MNDSIIVNGIEMDYIRFGTGERVFVILPGVDTKSILNSAMAIEAGYRAFAKSYTVYVFDRRKNMPDDYTIRGMASDTAEVMTALGLRDADIFGASQGGMMGMCIAIDRPGLVRRLVVGSSSARITPEINEGTERWIELAERGDMTALTADFIDNLYSEETIGKYRDFLMHLNDHVTQRDIDRFIIQAKAIEGFDIYDELDKIKCPTLVIGSEGDKLLPAACSREIAEKIGCELYLYGEEYGHCVFDEAPDYKQRLLDFFNK